ncbi:MAG: VWA domain-containing protein [Burkholderiales bacterium]|nr:VWA domain-containing protein [Burkholderiales bacterium]
MKRWASRVERWRADPARGSLVVAALALAATFLNPGIALDRPRYDEVVVIDITQSMNVPDYSVDGRAVTRLEFVKSALRAALDDLPCGSKLGWGLFTEARTYLLYTPVEVCANRAELRATLAGIGSRMAWAGNSEIAKGLHSGWLAMQQLPDHPALVFVTDGQESPPLANANRPHYDDKPGEIGGLIVGVGDPKPSPIPKTDPAGHDLGFWGPRDVAQTDPRNQGRGGSVGAEAMAGNTAINDNGIGATPGSEHLSGLREPYLRLLAADRGFAFLRLRAPAELSAALRAPALARAMTVRTDARVWLGLLALAALLAPYAGRISARINARINAR